MSTSNPTAAVQPARDPGLPGMAKLRSSPAKATLDPGQKMARAAARLAQILLPGAALVSVLMGVSTGKGARTAIGVAITAFVLFTAAGAVGSVLGFLFGLPRE